MNIAFQPTDKVLSTAGGLEVFSRLMKKTKIESKILPCLPPLKSGLSRSATKFHNLMLGFAQGATCLDDMERCHQVLDKKQVTKDGFADGSQNSGIKKGPITGLKIFSTGGISHSGYNLLVLFRHLAES